MTLMEWLSTRWRQTAPAPERHDPVAPPPQPKPRVPAEYLPLYTYLEHRYASTVVLTFGQMEALLGFALPQPARTEPTWWTGLAVRTDRHADAWTVARRTAVPTLTASIVAFERLP